MALTRVSVGAARGLALGALLVDLEEATDLLRYGRMPRV